MDYVSLVNKQIDKQYTMDTQAIHKLYTSNKKR